MLIDCHAHLESYSEHELAQVLERGRSAGVELVISAGTTVGSSRRSVALSHAFSGLFSGVGIHPMDLQGPIDEDAIRELRRLVMSTDKVLVMSEIGLDFMEGATDRATQYQAFREQIRLARELALPIVFHSREAHSETLRVLREERAYEVGGAMHYFQADEDTAREAIDLGFYISLARPLLRLPELQQTASNLPLESLVLETDAAPQPFKAKRENWTEPRHVRPIAERLAELKGLPVAEVEAATSDNVVSMLGTRWSAVRSYLDI